MRNIYIGIVVILVIAIGAFVFVQNNYSSKKTSTSSNNSSSNNSSSTTNTTALDTVTVTYSSSGFSPSSAILKVGGKLTVTNSSSDDISFNSDPHPSHTDNSELNIGMIGAGESKTVTLNKTGSWGYHNHLNPDQIGTIVVK